MFEITEACEPQDVCTSCAVLSDLDGREIAGVLPPEQSSCWESDFRLVWRPWGCRSLKGTAFRGAVQSVSPVQYGFMLVELLRVR